MWRRDHAEVITGINPHDNDTVATNTQVMLRVCTLRALAFPSVDDIYTVVTLLTHTHRDTPGSIGYEGVWVLKKRVKRGPKTTIKIEKNQEKFITGLLGHQELIRRK
jgi:hypothetical protein